jgi:hypothetical protein
VLDRCRASVTEFRELSKEVASLELILDEIQSFWTSQKARGHDLPEERKIGLSKISNGCQAVLDDLNALLNKHRELGKGQSLRQRRKWAPKDIGPMRSKLMAQTMLLTAFHATLASVSSGQICKSTTLLTWKYIFDYLGCTAKITRSDTASCKYHTQGL